MFGVSRIAVSRIALPLIAIPPSFVPSLAIPWVVLGRLPALPRGADCQHQPTVGSAVRSATFSSPARKVTDVPWVGAWRWAPNERPACVGLQQALFHRNAPPFAKDPEVAPATRLNFSAMWRRATRQPPASVSTGVSKRAGQGRYLAGSRGKNSTSRLGYFSGITRSKSTCLGIGIHRATPRYGRPHRRLMAHRPGRLSCRPPLESPSHGQVGTETRARWEFIRVRVHQPHRAE